MGREPPAGCSGPDDDCYFQSSLFLVCGKLGFSELSEKGYSSEAGLPSLFYIQGRTHVAIHVTRGEPVEEIACTKQAAAAEVVNAGVGGARRALAELGLGSHVMPQQGYGAAVIKGRTNFSNFPGR